MIKNIGILFETKADAEALGSPLENLYHWREEIEIEAITEAIHSLGYKSQLIGNSTKLVFGAQRIKKEIDLIFNISVGFITRHRMSDAPGICTAMGIPYTGADPYTKMVSQNKQLTKSLFDKLKIPTPEWSLVHNIDERFDVPEFPCLVKPAYEGASIGLGPRALVSNIAELNEYLTYVLVELKMPAIIERFIIGKEIKVGIVGDSIRYFEGIIEDQLDNGSALGEKFMHFAAKKEGQFKKSPLKIDCPSLESVIRDCRRIYEMMQPIDYATFDLRIDRDGHHYFLEFNADATLHPHRTLAQCCELHGFSYQNLIKGIIDSAQLRQKSKTVVSGSFDSNQLSC